MVFVANDTHFHDTVNFYIDNNIVCGLSSTEQLEISTIPATLINL